MKKITIIIAFLIACSAYPQLQVIETEDPIEIGKVGAPMMPFDIKCDKIDDTYIFAYKDIKFQHLTEYKSFEVIGEKDFESLYNMIIDGLENQPDDEIMLKIDKGYLWLKFKKSFGRYVQIGHAVDENANVIGFSRWLTENQVKRLFGKK